MSNGLYLTPDEHFTFSTDITIDEDGNIVYGEKAKKVLRKAMSRAERKSARQERHELSDPSVLAEYKAKLVKILDISNRKIAAGLAGLLSARYISKELLKLGKNAVMDTQELRDLYLAYKTANSNIKPATLNNDPDDYLDFDD